MNQVTFHKTLGKSLFLVLILALAAGTVPVLAAEDITGDWEITMDFNGRQSFATLSISKNADGTLAGKWGSDGAVRCQIRRPKAHLCSHHQDAGPRIQNDLRGNPEGRQAHGQNYQATAENSLPMAPA